jgi:hypothetical protein
MITRFAEIKDTRLIKYKCCTCGKSRVKTLSEYMTESPYNRNPDGSVRSRDEIRVALKALMYEKVVSFLAHPVCKKCSDEGQPRKKEGDDVATN